MSDTTKMYIHKFSFQHLGKILLVTPKTPRSCLGDAHLGILPVTVATPERSFSMMKRIKIELQNSISDKRLRDFA